MTPRPTREELVALLFSDPASECFLDDAGHVLDSEASGRTFHCDEGDRLGAVKEILAIVASEVGDIDMALEGTSAVGDAKDIACSAKRGAILLLMAAWAAENALKPKRTPAPVDGKPQPEQLSFDEMPGGTP